MHVRSWAFIYRRVNNNDIYVRLVKLRLVKNYIQRRKRKGRQRRRRSFWALSSIPQAANCTVVPAALPSQNSFIGDITVIQELSDSLVSLELFAKGRIPQYIGLFDDRIVDNPVFFPVKWT